MLEIISSVYIYVCKEKKEVFSFSSRIIPHKQFPFLL